MAVGDELPTDNVVYNLENSSGIYDWGGGSYTNGSMVGANGFRFYDKH